MALREHRPPPVTRYPAPDEGKAVQNKTLITATAIIALIAMGVSVLALAIL